jgi:hypothetical protein
VIGHPAENPSRLTCHDWMCAGQSPWNQASVRALRVPETAPWALRVHEAGEYEVTLRLLAVFVDADGAEIGAPYACVRKR